MLMAGIDGVENKIDPGDMLREAVAAGTRFGQQAKATIDSGNLVPDDVVLGIISERLSEADARDGFILDGFPRTVAQAEALDRMLARTGTPVAAVPYIEVPQELLLARLTGRRTDGRARATSRCASSTTSTCRTPRTGTSTSTATRSCASRKEGRPPGTARWR